MIRKRRMYSAQILLSAVFALVGSQAIGAEDWSKVVEAANGEGQVLLYSSRADADNARLMEGFMKKHPKIQAKAIRLVGAGLTSRVDQELRAGALAADVVLVSEAGWAIQKAKEGKLVTPEGPSVALWKGAEASYQSGVVEVANEPWVIGYNTNLVKTPPKDWDSLLGATEFKGRVGLNEVNGFTVAVWFDFLERRDPNYLPALAKLEPRLYPNSAPLTAGLTSGEIAWAPYSLPSTIEPMKARGAPVDYVVPANGTWSLERNAFVLKDAPHLNAGKLLLDYMMSQEGQEILNGKRSGYSVAPGVKLTDGIPIDLKMIAKINYLSFDPVQDVKKWQAKVDQLFRK